MRTPGKHLFIVGLPRSGTTLLCSLLNRHPDVALLYECEALVVPEPFASLRLHRDWLVRLEFWNRALTRNHCHIHPNAAALRNVADPRELYEFYASGKGASFSGEKSIEYGRSLPRLLRSFPDARIIIIRRELHQVYRSALQQGREGLNVDLGALHRLIYGWERLIRGVRSLNARNIPLRCVDYANLVEHPVDVCRELCAFLDLEFWPAMVQLGGKEADLEFTGAALAKHLERIEIGARELDDSLVPASQQELISRFQRRWDRLEGKTSSPPQTTSPEPSLVEWFACMALGSILLRGRTAKRVLYEFLPLEWLGLYRSIKLDPHHPDEGVAKVLSLIGKENLFFQQVSPSATVAVSILALGLVAIADVITGPAITMAPFYLIPVFLVTRSCGAPWGRIAALASAGVWSAIQIMQTGIRFPQLPVFVWDTAMRFILFLVFIGMLIRLLPEGPPETRSST